MTLKEILIAGKLTVSEGGGGDYTLDGLFTGQEPTGAIEWKATANIPTSGIAARNAITSLTIDLTDGYVLNGYSIRDNAALETVHLKFGADSAVNIPSYCVSSNANLTTIVVEGGLASIGQSGFRGNNKLKTVDMESLSPNKIGNNAFFSSTFDTLILRQEDAPILINSTQTFDATKFASNGAGGTLYVPQALISEYQADSIWRTILGYTNNQIKAIEGSVYETQYADGTPIA